MNTHNQTVTLDGRDYVVLARDDYEKLVTLAKAADLPALPERDGEGNYPAVEYARATIARGIIRDRVALGMSQRALAEAAGIRVEVLCRIEKGKHVPTIGTVEKIDRALKRAAGAAVDSAKQAKRQRKGAK